MEMDQHISDLLYCFDCVIIPEFGGFVANYQSAKLDPVKQVLHPPHKGILFNKNLTHNDGLLANQIAKHDNRTYDEANGIIRDYVQECKLTLDSGQRIEINKVGILYFDHERNIQFDADDRVNYLQESFGLGKVFAPRVAKPTIVEETTAEPVKEEKAEEVKVIPIGKPVFEKKENKPATDEEQPSTPTKKPAAEHAKPEVRKDTVVRELKKEEEEDEVRKRKWGWYVAAACLLPILFYSVWIPTQTDAWQTKHLQASDFNPFHSDTAPEYIENQGLEPFVVEVNPNAAEEFFAAIEENTVELDFTEDGSIAPLIVIIRTPEVAEPDNTYVEPDNTNVTPDTSGNRYFIIGGCFQYLDNAEGLVGDLRQRGFDAYIVDQHKGLHRVAFGSYATRDDAEDALPSIQNAENSSAWILKK